MWVCFLCRYFVLLMIKSPYPSKKPAPVRKPLSEVDLLRLTDLVIFGQDRSNLSDAELKTARATKEYQMLQRIGIAMYRAGEQGQRPPPALMVVERAEAREEPETAETTTE